MFSKNKKVKSYTHLFFTKPKSKPIVIDLKEPPKPLIKPKSKIEK